MVYKSLNHDAPLVSFRQAVINGIAPDKGLYFPEKIIPLASSFFENIEHFSKEAIAFQVIQPFIGNDIPDKELKQIIAETIAFDFPIVKITENIYSLELYHGPTLAFKDVGARFMARCLAYFNSENPLQKNTILVATSGDTGGAVADGFLNVKGVDVIILYPEGKVSDIQERQLTTLGHNITALAVAGVFDDCQAMVKEAFLDADLKHRNLTSANSINVARWLPQMFYYFFAYQALKKLNQPLIVSVPSGNFGNIAAGILAKKLGLPIQHFIAATNSNDTVPRFLEDGNYNPTSSIATLSNAMDVGNPSNFIRIQAMYQDNIVELKRDFSSYSFSDEETLVGLKELYFNHNYLAEPHGAIGYLGLQKEIKENTNLIGVFLETAHPIKFLEHVEPTLGIQIPMPKSIQTIMQKEKKNTKIKTYLDLKNLLS
jgi:threonine synthase